MQWIYKTGLSNVLSTVVTFPTPFTSTNYCVTMGAVQGYGFDGAGHDYNFVCKNNNSSFYASTCNGTKGAMFIAIGY